MTTLYLTEPHSVVRKDGETLLVTIPADPANGREKRKVRIPMMKVEQVVVLGDSTVTTPALLALLAQQVEICFCTYHGHFRGRLAPGESKNIYVRLAQFRHYEDYPRRVALAARFVRGKLHNQRTLLLRSNRTREDETVAAQAESLRELIAQVDALQIEAERPDPGQIQRDSAMGRLQGLEGAGASAFFTGFARLLKQDLGFRKRVRRPPTDPVNVLLGFGYTLLLNHVLSALGIVGMDPYLGFLHSEGYGRPALALDLMEEMRTPVVDSVVMTVINKQILGPEHFRENLGMVELTPSGRRIFLEQFEHRMNTQITHPVFGYKATYRRCLELQARLLAKYLLGEIPTYRPFQIR